MKKKLLSLLLVLCMVLPMIPVGVIVAAAADATAVTLYKADGSVWQTLSGAQGTILDLPAYPAAEGQDFAGWDLNGDGKADYADCGSLVVPAAALELKPVFAGKEVFVPGKTSFDGANRPVTSGATVTFNGGWQMGYVSGAVFTAYNKYDGSNFICLNGGDVWGSHGGLYANGGSQHGMIAMAKDGRHSTVAYTMPFTGTVELGYDQLISRRQVNPGDPANFVELDVAIYVNGTKVWPAESDWYHYKSAESHADAVYYEDVLAYMKATKVATADGVVATLSVVKGDVITFRAQRGNQHTWMMYEKPFVNAINDEGPLHATSMSGNLPLYDMTTALSGDSMVFRGNWSWVSYPANAWGNATVLDTHRSPAKWDGEPMSKYISNGDNFVLAKKATGLWSGDCVVTMNERGANQWGSQHGIGVTNVNNAGLRYIAEYDGRVSITIPSLTTCRVAPRFAIFVNGEMVWPTKGGSYIDIGDWYHSDAQKANTYVNIASDIAKTAEGGILANVRVAKGDTIELLGKSETELWGALGNVMDLNVQYTKIFGGEDLLVSVEDPNTGSFEMTELKNGESFTLPVLETIPEDFLGWVDANGVEYLMGQTITVTTNLKLTKIFKQYEKYTELYAGNENWPVVEADGASYKLVSDFQGGWYAAKYDDGVITNLKYNPAYATYGNWNEGILWLPGTKHSAVDRFARCNIGGSTANAATQGIGYSYTVSYGGMIRINAAFAVPSAKDLGAVTFKLMKIDAAGNETVVYEDTYTAPSALDVAVKHVKVNAGDILFFSYFAKDPKTGWSSPSFCESFNASIAYETTIETENRVTVSFDHPATGRPYIYELKKGDSFTFPELENFVFFGWDADNDGKVDYRAFQTVESMEESIVIKPVIAGSSSLYNSMPSWDAVTGSVNYKNGWSIGVYDKLANNYMPFTSYDTKYNIVCNYGTPWNSWGGMYTTGDRQFALANMTAAGSFWSQTQYNADMKGTIVIDYNKLVGIRQTTPGEPDGNISFKLAIYKSGEKIWPAGDEWFTYEGETVYETPENGQSRWSENILNLVKATGAFPMKVDVDAGDTIEFRIEQGNGQCRMFQMDVSAAYTALDEDPTIRETSVTVKDTFTLNIFSHLSSRHFDFKAAGLNVWLSREAAETGEGADLSLYNNKPYAVKHAEGAILTDVTYMFSIPEIAAQDLNRKYYVQSWVEFEDGSVATGEIVEVSVSGYAENALAATKTEPNTALNRVANALLQYAIAIDNYNYGCSNLQMPEELPVMPEINPQDHYNLTPSNGKVTIIGANLKIGATVDMEVYFRSTLPAEKLTLQMDDNAGFKSPTKVKITQLANGQYMATVKIKTADFNKPFYFRVTDHRGDVQSGVLTYSVESYVARMYAQQPENEKLINLLHAMLLVCKTANDVR